MFERFTERARKVVVLAQEEAGTMHHDYIGTEHMLLGLLREQDSLAADVLADFGVGVEDTRNRVVGINGTGEVTAPRPAPFTPHAKLMLERALHEAIDLQRNFIATEHLLLAVTNQEESVAGKILVEQNIDLDQLRLEITRRIGATPGNINKDSDLGDVTWFEPTVSFQVNHRCEECGHVSEFDINFSSKSDNS